MASPKLPPKVIGFTYGTFDLLHDGHRHLLRHARSRCDQLIVAIDSDRRARELKGPGRPVEDETVRSHNVVATGLVWRVLAVDDGAQLRAAVAYYEPEILFKGAPEAGRDAADRIFATASSRLRGICYVARLPGHSTTNAIKERLQ